MRRTSGRIQVDREDGLNYEARICASCIYLYGLVARVACPRHPDGDVCAGRTIVTNVLNIGGLKLTRFKRICLRTVFTQRVVVMGRLNRLNGNMIFSNAENNTLSKMGTER
jgi:hypothetical protein